MLADPWALGALCLGGFALGFAALPLLHVLTIPLSLAGLVVGILGYVQKPEPRNWWLIGGGSLSLVVLFAKLFFPALWNRPTHAPVPIRPADQQIVVSGRSLEAGQPVAGEGWTNTGQGALRQGDVQIRVPEVRFSTVPLSGPGGKRWISPKKHLVLRVKVSNIGAARSIPYETWGAPGSAGGKHLPQLRDPQGQLVPLSEFVPGCTVVGRVTMASVGPGRHIEDVLVFDAPKGPVEFFRLELPATACGGMGTFRLEIPASQLALPPRGKRP
jgi:hypothetical protein